MVNKIKGTTGDDVLIGTANVDYIETLTGNDTVSAAAATTSSGSRPVPDDEGGDNGERAFSASADLRRGRDHRSRQDDQWHLHDNQCRIPGRPQGVDQLWGTEGANFLDGDAGSDHLYGRGGNDTFRDLVGQNEIDGGTGTDTLRFDQAAAGWTIDLSTGRCVDKVSPGNQNIVKSIEVVYGGSYADMFAASSGADTFYGQDGNDTFVGIGKGDFVNGARVSTRSTSARAQPERLCR